MDSTPDRAEQTDEADVEQATVPDADGVVQAAPQSPGLAKWLVIYSALRIGMLVVLAAVLSLLGMPLILALLFAVILALPLSWLLFSGVRGRVNAAMAISTAHRRAERERLRSALNESPGDPVEQIPNGIPDAPVNEHLSDQGPR